MTLLAPLAGLLAGGIGLAALLALHALKLRRRPVRVSSTLLWRDAVRDLEVNIPWRAPRPTLLLLLQGLAVLLLALAIARPVLGDSDRVPGRVIIVVDASASMSATDADASGTARLDRAKRLATDRLAALRRGAGVPEIAVIRAALEPRMVVAPTRSIEGAIAGIRAIEPTDQPLDADALRTVLAALLDRTTGTGEDPEAPGDEQPTLWVFTDAGPGSGVAARDFPGWSGTIVPVADQAGDNTGIAALHASRDPADPASARVFLRVISNADRPVGLVAEVTVRPLAGSARGGASAAPAPATRVPLQIPAATPDGPGSLTRTIQVQAPGSSRIAVTLDPGGVLASDDTAWVDLPDPSPPRTVVFAPDARADPFLMDVLGVLAPGAVSVHAPGETDALRGAGLAVYDRVTPARLPPIPSLGFASAWPGSDDAETAGRERIIAWDRTHPVLRDLSLSSVVFDRAVALPDASTPGISLLAEARSGPVVIEGVGGGVRHIRVAFPLNRSNWAVDVGMPIFVAAAFERLAPGVRGEGTARTTGASIEVRATGGTVRVSGPVDAVVPASGEGVATIAPLARVGEYTLAGAPDTPTLAVSLLDAAESAVPVGPGERFGRDAAPGPRSARASGEGRRELWPHALLAALVFMTLEWLVHARRARV